MVMSSGAPDLSWLLCYQLQLSGGFSIVSTLAAMSFVGILFGVPVKCKPFSRSFSWGDVLVERLTTHLDLSIVIWSLSSSTCFC